MIGKWALSEDILHGVMRECFLLENQSLQLFYIFTSFDDERFCFDLALLVDAINLCVNFALSVFRVRLPDVVNIRETDFPKLRHAEFHNQKGDYSFGTAEIFVTIAGNISLQQLFCTTTS